MRRVEMVPEFLREIEAYLALGPVERARPTPLFFVFHLLGEWRERAAYRPLARLLRCPPHEMDAILGDASTSTAHRVMAAVFDGDPDPIYQIIQDPKASEFVRSRMCEALAMLVLRDELDQGVVGQFLRDAFTELRPQAQSFVWQGWQSAIALLGLVELKPLVKRAFDRGFISKDWLDYGDFDRDLQWAIRHPGEPRHPNDDEFTLFGDTVEELSRWYGFSETAHGDDEESVLDFAESEPYRNPFKGIGRNDPCPCGSGKKFKNCCLKR